MIEEIILLDSNPMKVKGYNDWFKIVSRRKHMYDVESDILGAGLKETLENIGQAQKEESFTVKEKFHELKSFHKLVENRYVELINNLHHSRHQGRFFKKTIKQNKKLYGEILHNMRTFSSIMVKKIYDPTIHKGFADFYKLMDLAINSSEIKDLNIKCQDYSESDKKLVLTALVRANNGLSTSIFSPDKHMSEIYCLNLLKLSQINNSNINNLAYLDDKIQIIFTYDGRRLRETKVIC